MRYILKEEYKNTSIAPNGKVVELALLSQEHIKALIKWSNECSKFFDIKDTKNTKDTKESKESK
jgi:hypothetical protein